MRTTLTIEQDVASLLKKEMKRKGMKFKEIVNAVLRRGLEEERIAPIRPKVITRPQRFGVKADIDLDKLNQLCDELEAGVFAEKISG